eukprot:358619-Chlamydomonas_euryale.AAC.15
MAMRPTGGGDARTGTRGARSPRQEQPRPSPARACDASARLTVTPRRGVPAGDAGQPAYRHGQHTHHVRSDAGHQGRLVRLVAAPTRRARVLAGEPRPALRRTSQKGRRAAIGASGVVIPVSGYAGLLLLRAVHFWCADRWTSRPRRPGHEGRGRGLGSLRWLPLLLAAVHARAVRLLAGTRNSHGHVEGCQAGAAGDRQGAEHALHGACIMAQLWAALYKIYCDCHT